MALLEITITDAGRAEIVNADNTGTGPVEITEIGLGTGQYTPDPTQTALVSEVKRISTISGLVLSPALIHVIGRDDTTDAYSVSEFGLYTESGTLFAVYSQGTPYAEKVSGSSFLIAVDIAITTLDATSITFGDTTFVNPPATLTQQGIAFLGMDNRIILSAAADLQSGRVQHIISNNTFTLPDVSTISPGDTVVLTKSVYNSPVIQVHGGASEGIRIGMQDGSTITDTSITFDINAEIILVWNSTDWEV